MIVYRPIRLGLLLLEVHHLRFKGFFVSICSVVSRRNPQYLLGMYKHKLNI